MLPIIPVAYLLLLLIGGVGWVLNIISTIGLITHSAPMDAMFIGRIVGIPVAVLGAILGWL